MTLTTTERQDRLKLLKSFGKQYQGESFSSFQITDGHVETDFEEMDSQIVLPIGDMILPIDVSGSMK